MFTYTYQQFLYDVSRYGTINEYIQAMPSIIPMLQHHAKSTQIPPCLQMSIERHQQTLYFKIFYRNLPDTEDFLRFKQLPYDVSRIIHSYLGDTIKLYIEIQYPDSYPFNPPVWNLLRVSHNQVETKPLYIEKYYHAMIKIHNAQNSLERRPSPVCTIGQDLAHFVKKVNHFEHVVNMKK